MMAGGRQHHHHPEEEVEEEQEEARKESSCDNSADADREGGCASASASSTALDASVGDRGFRVPYFCEENVWRLAYRKTRCRGGDFTDRCDGGENGGGGGAHQHHRYFVAFVSNLGRTVPMLHQCAGSPADGYVCWDYHVILLRAVSRAQTTARTTTEEGASRKASGGAGMGWKDGTMEDSAEVEVEVLDVDTLLPYPCPLGEYLERSFPFDFNGGNSKYAPQFRVLPAESYLDHFSSDRRHMYDEQNGRWKAPPPPYSCIIAGGNSNRKKCSTTIYVPDPSNNLERLYLDFANRSVGVILTLDELKRHDFFGDCGVGHCDRL